MYVFELHRHVTTSIYQNKTYCNEINCYNQPFDKEMVVFGKTHNKMASTVYVSAFVDLTLAMLG